MGKIPEIADKDGAGEDVYSGEKVLVKDFAGVSNERWNHIEELIKSYNSNDWRQAIIEADLILEEMLEKIGYAGMTIGDKLKNVEPSDFNTLNQAWEAHKIRNKIAHEGSKFALSREDAERAVGLYREVFKEFYYI